MVYMSIDSIIFIAFLILNLGIGLFSGLGIKNIREYAIGNRNFSTTTIAATIIATWVSGSLFFTILSETYSNGLYYIWTRIAVVLAFFIVGFTFAPRMGWFLGKLSVAEAMGNLYGTKVRLITAVASVIGTAGYIAVQFKVAGLLFEYCFNINIAYGVIIGAFIVTLYSSFGGVKSVTFTDLIQLITFGTIIPIIAFFIINEMETLDLVVDSLSNNPSFDIQKVFDFTQPKSLYYLFLFMYSLIPALNPATFQRIAMAKSIGQVKKSFFISGIIYFFLSLIVVWVSILVSSSNPNLLPKDITKHIIFNYSYIGLKGLTLAGIMAMVMSTADSYINSTAIIIVHDFCKVLKLKFVKNELVSARFTSLLIGTFALILALKGENLLKIIIASNSFYMPIVTVPLTLAVFSFHSDSRSVLIGMAAGFITVVSWYLANITFIDPIVPGMLANLIFLLGNHYLFKQQRGSWIEKEKESQLKPPPRGCLVKMQNIIKGIINLIKESAPDTSRHYITVGFFCMAMTYATMHSIPRDVYLKYPELIKFMTFSSLFFATALLSNPLWFEAWREKKLIAGIIWNFVIFSVLICYAFSFIIITNFSSMQVMIFTINLIIIAGLLRWQLVLFMLFTGVFLSLQLMKNYIVTVDYFTTISVSTQLKIAYLLILISGIMVIVFRPKQEYQILTKKRKEYLSERIGAQEEQLIDALNYQEKVARNLSKEGLEILQQAQEIIDNLRKQIITNFGEDFTTIAYNKLTSIMMYLKEVANQAKDYIRLEVKNVDINFLLTKIDNKITNLDNSIELTFFNTTHYKTMECDINLIKRLLVNIITQIKEYSIKTNNIQIHIDSTELWYRLDSIEHYTKKIPAIRFIITTLEEIGKLPSFYMGDVTQAIFTFNNKQDLYKAENIKIVNAHYGILHSNELNNEYTIIVVLPLNIRDVRPKTMDLKENETVLQEAVNNSAELEKIEMQLIQDINKSNPNIDITKIKKAINLIKKYHAKQKRKSGEPFYLHPLAVTKILLQFTSDEDALLASLLHDTVEDTPMSLSKIEAIFNPTVAKLVNGVTKFDQVKEKLKLSEYENIQKLIEQEDKKVQMIKIADRIHNMRTLSNLESYEKQKNISEQTLQFYVPMAKKLGLTNAATELQQLVFKTLNSNINGSDTAAIPNMSWKL